MFFSIEQIAGMRTYVKRHKFYGYHRLSRYTDEELQKICNGIGGDNMPSILNKAISALNPSLVPASFVHDVEWFESRGTEREFLKTNARFELNGHLAADIKYPRWWQYPARWWVKRKARLFREILDSVAFSHYQECFLEKKKND